VSEGGEGGWYGTIVDWRKNDAKAEVVREGGSIPVEAVGNVKAQFSSIGGDRN
jgi:hypothetical protein